MGRNVRRGGRGRGNVGRRAGEVKRRRERGCEERSGEEGKAHGPWGGSWKRGGEGGGRFHGCGRGQRGSNGCGHRLTIEDKMSRRKRAEDGRESGGRGREPRRRRGVINLRNEEKGGVSAGRGCAGRGAGTRASRRRTCRPRAHHGVQRGQAARHAVQGVRGAERGERSAEPLPR